MKRFLLLALFLTLILGGIKADSGMKVKDDILYDYSGNLMYRIVKAPTATEYGEVLLAGLCERDAATTSVFAASRVIIDQGTPLEGSYEKYVNDYSYEINKGYKIMGVDGGGFLLQYITDFSGLVKHNPAQHRRRSLSRLYGID